MEVHILPSVGWHTPFDGIPRQVFGLPIITCSLAEAPEVLAKICGYFCPPMVWAGAKKPDHRTCGRPRVKHRR